MVFVNEFISEENLERFRIRDIWNRYHPFGKSDVNLNHKHSWTYDREKEVFLIPVLTGKEEQSNQITFVFWWDQAELSIVLNKFGLDGGAGVRWELESIRKQSGEQVDNGAVIPVLKEALETYGYRGVWKQINNYSVKFGF